MSVIVGLDTSTDDVAVAATAAGELVAEQTLEPEPGERPRHATHLLAAIERAVDAAGGWEAVDLVAVGVGPGSFTGLRIGVATARALAQGLDKPVTGVGSLAALARGIGGGSERPRLAVFDARRGEAFAALYGSDGVEQWPPLVTAPAELVDRVAALSEPPLSAGSGALRFRSELESAGAEVLPEGHEAHRMAARHLCALAGEPVALDSIEPVYLRRPDAELWRERDNS